MKRLKLLFYPDKTCVEVKIYPSSNSFSPMWYLEYRYKGCIFWRSVYLTFTFSGQYKPSFYYYYFSLDKQKLIDLANRIIANPSYIEKHNEEQEEIYKKALIEFNKNLGNHRKITLKNCK